MEPAPLPHKSSHCPLEPINSCALLDRLRNETNEQHQRLEHALNLLRPDLARTAYTHILGRFYGFYHPWESHLAPLASQLLPDFDKRHQKVSNLLADLKYLAIESSALPLCSYVPSYDNAIAALGALYVQEGATLGGQIISRHLRRKFSFPKGQGDAFFQSYGRNVGEMWSSFRTVLTSYSSPSDDDQIIRAATETFAALHRWFAETK